MGVDYYKILQVDRSAKEDDLKKAYLRFSEAYDVISDPKKRAVYDQYGEEGLKGQVPPPSSPGGTSSRSNPRSADDIFVDTFGSSNPFGGTSSRSNPRSTEGIFGETFGSSSPFGGGGMGAGGGTRGGRSPGGGMPADDVFREFFGRGGGEGSVFPLRQQKAAAIENQLPCSLEDLYKGTTKKMKISREILDFSGKSLLVEEILTIDIKPGWKKGTKIAFPEKGNQASNIIPADVVFIVDEKPHDVYTREGNDLVMTQRITLLEALLGFTVQLATLDGRSLTVPVNTIIHPGYEEVVPQEGMPIPRNPSERGTLRIKFNIKFPSRLTAEQKTGLMKLLPARLP